MRLGSAEALTAQSDQPRIDDNAALAKGGIAVARREHAPNASAPADTAASEPAASRPDRRTAPRQIGGGKNAVQKLALSSAFAGPAHAAELGFEIIIVCHDRGHPGWKSPTMRVCQAHENRCRPERRKSAIPELAGTAEPQPALFRRNNKMMCRQELMACRRRGTVP